MDSGIKQALTECNLSYFNVSEKKQCKNCAMEVPIIISDQKET